MGGRALILLDTHVLIWLDQDDPALGPAARGRADEALRAGELAVSAISFWEVAMLAAKRRIVMKMPLDSWRRDFLGSGLIEIPLDGQVGIAAVELSDFHADPADRIIIASAIHNGAAVLTADRSMLDWPGTLDRHDARV